MTASQQIMGEIVRECLQLCVAVCKQTVQKRYVTSIATASAYRILVERYGYQQVKVAICLQRSTRQKSYVSTVKLLKIKNDETFNRCLLAYDYALAANVTPVSPAGFTFNCLMCGRDVISLPVSKEQFTTNCCNAPIVLHKKLQNDTEKRN